MKVRKPKQRAITKILALMLTWIHVVSPCRARLHSVSLPG